ncbi:MAG TPA: transcription-repair coupling factor [Roseiflexaceae bacterium]|nr:transcription-repair coupling factor [Roseiflexaceae bacterium]
MAELDPFLQQIAAHERLEALAITLRAQPGLRLRYAPALTAARPALAAALASQHPQPLILAVTTGEAAQRAQSDLNAWLGPGAALLYPASDAMPYEHMSPAANVIAARLQVLQRLLPLRRAADEPAGAPAAPLVIVAPVKALLQPTLAPEELRAATLLLRRGDEHSPDALIQRWIAQGYRSAPTVEEPGELNRRGGIVDIFPPGDDLPLRIEFFGDEIDSLRRFDPVSQRSQAQSVSAAVGPAYEIPLWRRDEALARLRLLDTSSMRSEARDEWTAALERLAQGERFEGRALFAPFFRDPRRTTTLLDFLPRGAALLLSEALLLERHAADLDQQAEDRRAAHLEMGELPPDFPRPYLRWDELLARVPPGISLVDLSNNAELEADEGALSDTQTGIAAAQDLAAPGFVQADLFGGQLKRLIGDIAARLRRGEQVLLVTPQAARMQELVAEALARGDEAAASRPDVRPTSGFVAVHGALDQGWRLPERSLTLYTDTEIFGWRARRPVTERSRKTDKRAEERAAFLRGLKPGDYVVHIEHGIAQYDGMIRRTVGGIEREYLNLRYAEGDRLYVPVDQVDRVSRYIGAGDAAPQLTRLGTQEWERAKRKARAAVQDLAEELLKLYAARQLSQGHAFSPDNEWQRELEDAFPYTETDDQLRAIAEVKQDMERTQPMDRLICGDVGFGKTEVALRAAFKAVQDGKQVAVLVPTTVLAQQHYDTFSRRMAAFPVKVEMISRFRSTRDQSAILQRLARGEIDIIVGTHRLLSKDITFKDLGLLIVDEEQRFGVRHKERIKQLRANIDVLTLTATPIPRTLHMALAGIRDMSVIDTPPQDRVPTRTYVVPYDDRLVREAVLRELDRGGQVFFVHNRVQSIYYVAHKLKQLVPEATVGVGHGQMDEHGLEKVMLDFFNGGTDVLVCTTIIENGLDVPNANTMIIDDATRYGLAQLYQLRGRVGRSTQRAYAYLFYANDHRISDEAQERLLAIQEATELGAGLRIAMRDLEIRGAGNLLGAEQSGHIAAVGFDLYTRLLEQAVGQLKTTFHESQPAEQRPAAPEPPSRAAEESTAPVPAATAGKKRAAAGQPVIKVDERVLISPLVTLDLPIDAYLPTDYIAEEQVRLAVYQRLAEAQAPEHVRDLRQELRDRFGDLPDPAECLLTWLMIKVLALRAGVSSIVTTDEEFVVRLPDGGLAEREALRRRFARDRAVRIGPQFVRLDRRELRGEWIPAVTGVLETIGSAHKAGARG